MSDIDWVSGRKLICCRSPFLALYWTSLYTAVAYDDVRVCIAADGVEISRCLLIVCHHRCHCRRSDSHAAN